MVPLGALTRIKNSVGPVMVMRYNMYTSAAVNGNPAPGVSSGDVVRDMTALANQLGVKFEWTEMTFLQVQAGNIALLIFALGAAFVYLVLAAKYESWRLPLAVILVVPLCMLAAVEGMVFGAPAGEYLRANRPVGVDWTSQQERHFDCRICSSVAERGQGIARGGAGGQCHPFSAHHHDFAGFCFWRQSVGGCQRRRHRDARILGSRGFQRHDRRDALWDIPDADFLFRAHVVQAAGPLIPLDPLEFFLDDSITFASSRLQSFAIEHGDPSAPIPNEVGFLHGPQNLGNAGAANTEHVREEFLGEREFVDIDAIAHSSESICSSTAGSDAGRCKPRPGRFV